MEKAAKKNIKYLSNETILKIGFLHRTTCICRMDFDMFLVFDPKSGFCMGYSPLCADLPNGLISGIFSVFWSGILHRTTPDELENGF